MLKIVFNRLREIPGFQEDYFRLNKIVRFHVIKMVLAIFHPNSYDLKHYTFLWEKP
jgi:hypothetical protein